MKFLTAVLLLIISGSALAQLLISPTYAQFNDNDRTREIILVNPTNEVKTYRLGWSDKIQLQNGNYQNVEEGKDFEYSASSYLRYSPRQVRLQPGERQIIKVFKRNTTSLPEGDYRSHLNFKVVPEASQTDETNTQGGMRLRLNANISYSIPVVMSVGTETSNYSIADVKMSATPQTQQTLEVTIGKDGNFGTLGRINIYLVNENGAQGDRIGTLNGANVFRESSQVTFSVNLSSPLSAGDTYQVEYEDMMSRAVKAQKILKF